MAEQEFTLELVDVQVGENLVKQVKATKPSPDYSEFHTQEQLDELIAQLEKKLAEAKRRRAMFNSK